MPPFVTLEGIVLRAADYRDYDRMLTLLTPQRGLISCAAYGARRIKSPLLNAASPLVSGQYVLREQKGRLTLASCALGQMHFEIRKDPVRFAYASFASELCLSAVQPEEESPDIFRLMRETLAYLNYSGVGPRSIILPFLMRFANLMGMGMELRHCVQCQGRLVDARFDAKLGGAVCITCAKGQALPILTRETMLALRKSLSGNLEPVDCDEAFAFACDHVTYRFERAFSALKIARALES